MKKRVLTFALIIALMAICLGGTLAFLSDKDAVHNTFTIGNVKIELIESQYQRVTHNKTDAELKADAKTYQTYLANAGKDIVPGRKIGKAPYVVNTGKSDAYVRIRMLVPTELYAKGIDITMTAAAFDEGAIAPIVQTEGRTIDGIQYDEYVFAYTDPVEAGKMTYWPPFWSIGLDSDVTSEQLEEFATKGLLTADSGFKVLVEADAIQAEGFQSAAEAFAAFDAQ